MLTNEELAALRKLPKSGNTKSMNLVSDSDAAILSRLAKDGYVDYEYPITPFGTFRVGLTDKGLKTI